MQEVVLRGKEGLYNLGSLSYVFFGFSGACSLSSIFAAPILIKRQTLQVFSN